MQTVRILRLSPQGVQEVGRIRWDGQRFHVDGQVAEALLHQPLDFVRPPITAAQGEQFLQGLQHQYYNPYLRATAPE